MAVESPSLIQSGVFSSVQKSPPTAPKTESQTIPVAYRCLCHSGQPYHLHFLQSSWANVDGTMHGRSCNPNKWYSLTPNPSRPCTPRLWDLGTKNPCVLRASPSPSFTCPGHRPLVGASSVAAVVWSDLRRRRRCPVRSPGIIGPWTRPQTTHAPQAPVRLGGEITLVDPNEARWKWAPHPFGKSGRIGSHMGR